MNRMIKYGLLVTMFFMASCGDFLEPKSQSEYVPKLVKSLDELLLGEVYMGPGYSDGQFYGCWGYSMTMWLFGRIGRRMLPRERR